MVLTPAEVDLFVVAHPRIKSVFPLSAIGFNDVSLLIGDYVSAFARPTSLLYRQGKDHKPYSYRGVSQVGKTEIPYLTIAKRCFMLWPSRIV